MLTRFLSMSLIALSAGPYFVTGIQAKECKALADVVFVLDESGSVGLPNFKKMLEFVKEIVRTFEIGNDDIKVGVMTFATNTVVQFQLNKYHDKNDLLNAIDRINYRGEGTNTDKALQFLSSYMFTISNGDRPNVPNIAVVITDGQSNSMADTIKAATNAHKSGINIISIGIGDQINSDELRQIASSKENVLMIKDFNKLQSLLPNLISLACENKCALNTCLNNGVCQVEKNGFSCLCADEFTGDRCERKVPLCTCTASGDPHYKTFDGQMIHFYGACKYTLASYKSGQCTFDVEGKHEYRGGNQAVTYMRLIDFKYKSHVYRLHRGRKFYVDGVQKYLPYTNMDGVIVQTTGNKVKLEGPCGVAIKFDGQHSFQLQIPRNIGNSVSGICGNCNSIADDLKTKDGIDVSNNNNKYSLIGNSFEVRDDSDLILPNCKPTVDIGEPCYSTQENLQANAKVSLCRYINPALIEDSPFKPCIKEDTSRAQKMFESCVIDYCSYFRMKDMLDTIVCQGLEGFADQCQEIGIPIDWRKGNICPVVCPANAVYKFRTSACPNTCLDRDASKNCTKLPVEGCECRDGYLLSDLECVPEFKCGCKTENSEYIPIDQSIESGDCTSVSTCRNVNGKPILTKQSRTPCGKNAVCSLVKDHFVCKCNAGFEGDPLQECKDKCSPNPCLNNGVCRVESSGFSCLCANGYTGNQCATKDKCSPNPCLNNGVCRIERSGFSCFCANGYTGYLCVTKVQETNTCRCQNVLNKLDTFETLLKKHDVTLQKIQENMSKVPRKIECVIKDVASNQLTGQSSDWPNLPSKNAVDGIFSTMSHTQRDKQPFWWVDLGRTYKVQRIEIYNRKDCCGERLHDLDVLVGPSLNSLTLCNHYKGPGRTGEHIITGCSQNIEGRFVKLMILKQEWLHVAEVKVYGCD